MTRAAIAMFCLYIMGCAATKTTQMSQQDVFILRLKPGMLLRESIQQFAISNKLTAAWISSCAGSLTKYSLRFANQPSVSSAEGHFEIVSLSGTVSADGCHLHIAVADSTGKVTGGHLLDGNIIYTTAEIVIQSTGKYILTREKDGTTPWEELQIRTSEKE